MGDVKLKKLISTSNEMELNMIMEILEDNNIAYITKNLGSGSYMRIIGGSSVFETEILVAEENYLWAKEILDSMIIV